MALSDECREKGETRAVWQQEAVSKGVAEKRRENVDDIDEFLE